MQIGGQIGDDILMRCRQQQADAEAIDESAEIKRYHPGEVPIERGCVFVSDDPVRFPGECERQQKAIALSFGKFLRSSQHQLGLSQAAVRQQIHGFLNRQWEGIDERLCGWRELVQREHPLTSRCQFSRELPHDGGLSRTTGPGKQDQLTRLERDFEIFGDDMRPLLEVDAKVIHHGSCPDRVDFRQELILN